MPQPNIDLEQRATLTHYAYCGMSVPYTDVETVADARVRAACLIRLRRRQGYPVTTLTRGASWEVLEPDDSVMVSDKCGVICLKPTKPVYVECWSCGEEYVKGENHECDISDWDDTDTEELG